MVSSKKALWATGQDEAVEVNQRALIDKILARYSGEFTVFRELLQNSDDAGARSVEIRFETEEYMSREEDDDTQSDESEQEDLPDLKTAVVHQWTFKNNGLQFREQDWSRLKKIADGNPDEKKIGAFGVGFYSLFSITEEPWVTSGGKWMNFYWKDKDHLYVRRGTEGDAVDAWTTFQMPLREPGPMPPAFDFTRFLVSSIPFMTYLSEVSVYFDDKRLVKLSKNPDVPKKVPMLKELKGMSPEGIMNVKSIKTTLLQIKAEVAEMVYKYKVASEKTLVASKTDIFKSSSHEASGFFSPLSDGFEASPTPQGTPTQAPVVHRESVHLLEAISSNIVLTIFTANVDVRVDEKMAGELVRATMKNPLSRLCYELIYMGKDEYDSSIRAEEEVAYGTGSVFQGLRADLEGKGSTRVYIGHATGQTTGFGGHMATRFIPTVERESIDLVDRNVAVWNKELLYVGGFLARLAYELELDAIKKMWERAVKGPDGLPDEEVQTRLRGRALHALKFFSFYSSTPSPLVSDLMKTAFFACSTTRPFPIIASDGVQNASKVYILHPEFSGFIKRLSVISEDIVDGARTMIDALRSRGAIKNITFADVLVELRSRPLSETETVECLKWWIGVTKEGNGLKVSQERSQFLDALEVSVTGPPERTMKLSDAQTFLKSKTSEAIIPTDGPLPSTLLPTSITCSFDRDTLVSAFLWRQLSIVDWLRHLTDPKVAATNLEFDVTKSASWTEQVLSVLVRAWPSLTKSDENDVIRTLSPISCVPTSTGLKVPNQAYFSNADLLNLFRDLPIVTMPSGAIVDDTLELVLRSLGVNKHVEFQIVFDRMVKTGDWTTYDLVNYLVSIQPNLTPQEFEDLKLISAFPKENAGREQAAQRYKAKDLYQPVDIFREFGLPTLDWGTNVQWDSTSNNARFIFSLGLRRMPPLQEILRIASSDNPTVQTKALTLFLDNLYDIYRDYNPKNFSDLAFVPAVLGSEKMLAKPFEVCIDPKWTALGFAVVDPLLPVGAAFKLRLERRPQNDDLMTLLERSPPEDEMTARNWFEILSDCVFEFSLNYLRKLSETPFVPVESTRYKGDIKRLQPRQCFRGKQPSELHSKLFAFVNFGTRANMFLKYCYTNEEPSAEDIAQVLLEDPWRVYKLANGRKNYLMLLHELASKKNKIEKETILRMRRSKILLGSRRVKSGGGDAAIGGDEDDQDDLLQPSEVVIVDDTNAHELFGDCIFCAPQDDTIEELYSSLGSPNLSSLIREDYSTYLELPDSKLAAEIRHLILDRLPLFLHKRSSSRIELSWLNQKKNLIVKVFEKITVTKSLHHGDVSESKSYDTSAIAKRGGLGGLGPIEVLLAGNNQLKMHELSTSLCGVIFKSPEVNDATLFMSILQTDLQVLKELGHPVDRILRQKEEREATEAEVLSASSAPETTAQETQTEILITQPKIPSLVTEATAPSELPTPSRQETPGNTGPEQTSKRPFGPVHHQHPNRPDSPSSRPTPSPKSEDIPESPRDSITPLSNITYSINMAIKRCTPERGKILMNLANNINKAVEECEPGGDNILLEIKNDINVATKASVPESDNLLKSLVNKISAAIGANASERNILLRNLVNDIEKAIEAGAPASGNPTTTQFDVRDWASSAVPKSNSFHTRLRYTVLSAMTNQKEMEPLDERYCDVTGETMKVGSAGKMLGIEVFAASDLPEPELLIKQKHDVLSRFIDLLRLLVEVYTIPETCLHIYADKDARFISFNKCGILFVNLRYFEAWHDNDVEQGNSGDALTFWYFMLAHGIAHNLVDKHDMKHEFYVSAICRAYLDLLIDRL